MAVGKTHGELADGFYGGLKPSPADDRDHLFGVARPRAFGPIDLADLAPDPTDQEQTSSCTAHCATKLRAALTNKWTRDNGQPGGQVYSELFEYWYTRVEDGDQNQDAGASMRSMCDAMLQHGALPADGWPWDAGAILQPPPGDLDTGRAEGISGYARVGSGRGMDLNGSIQAVLASGYPVALAINVYDNFFSLDGSGLSPSPVRGSRLLGGHAIPVFRWRPDGSPGGGRYGWRPSWANFGDGDGWAWISAAFVTRYTPECWYVA